MRISDDIISAQKTSPSEHNIECLAQVVASAGRRQEMRRPKAALFAAAVLGFGLTIEARAVCPVCTVAVTTGVGLSRWLGVDDSISGVWLGGLIVSIIIWSINWMEANAVRFKWRGLVTSLAYYLLFVAPLYVGGVLGQPGNSLYGIDKLALGIAAGSCAFYLGARWYERLKEKNLGHANFPFQKVVMPITPLIVLSALFYFLSKGGE